MKLHRGMSRIGLACVVGLMSWSSERASCAEPPMAEVSQAQPNPAIDQTAPPKNSPSASAQSESTPVEFGVQFRRVHVPERQIGAWSAAKQRFLPMKAEEFERMLRQFGSPSSPEPPPLPAELKSARYTATISDDALIAGQATLEIESFEKQTALLPLDPCRLAMESPRWVAKPTSAANTGRRGDGEPAALGARSDGKLAVRVAESGSLKFGWTMRGEREPGGGLMFPLRLPRCPSTELQLTLPTEFVPVVDQAIVTMLSDASQSREGGPKTLSRRGDPHARLWRIELGGQNLATLRIVTADAVRESRPLTLVREAATYEFSPRGLQLSVDLKLDVLHDAIRQIPLEIDSPLTLVTARVGDVQIPWYEANDESGGPTGFLSDAGIKENLALPLPVGVRADSHHIVLQLPEPLRSTGRVVRLGAVAPLALSGRLPSIRPASPGFFWQEGLTTLLIQSPLELDELRPNGCRQTKRESLPPDGQTEAVTLQNFRPDPDVQVAVGRRRDQFSADSGTLIDAGGASIRGTATIDITSQSGECFSLTASVPASWIIDSVDSTPAGNVSNWSLTRSAAAPSSLKISCAKAIRTDRPLRLVVNGRWGKAPNGETLRADDLQMLNFDDVRAGRRVTAIRVAAPLKLRISDDEKLSRLTPDKLEESDTSRLGDSAGTATILAFPEGATAAVTFSKVDPDYVGDIQLNLGVTDDTLTESYTLTCTPKSSEVDRLLVQFFPARSTPIEWAFLPDEKSPERTLLATITARRLSQPAQTKLGISLGEVWELSWQHPRAKAFRIKASRTSPLSSSLPVALAQLPGAAAQHGRVEIRSALMHHREIRNRRLQQVDCPTAPADRWPEVIAVYEYNPAEQAALSAADPLPSLTVGPGGTPPDAWVWSLQVDARLLRQGYCENTAIWRIENTGRTRITIKIPVSAVIGALWIDGTPVPSPVTNSAGALDLELPAGRRFPVVVLHWSCQEPPLAILSRRSLEMPEVADMPVLARKLRLWLPPNWRPIGGPIANSFTDTVSWSQRLFGPLGQPVGDAPFDPLALKDWRRLASPQGADDASWMEAARIVSEINSSARATALSSSKALPTWGEVLRAVAPAAARDDRESPSLLIDRQALADAGIFPETMEGQPADVRDRTDSVFDDADLTILVSADALLLTTRSAASQWLNVAPGASDSSLMRVPAGELREQLRAAAAGVNDAFVPKDLWGLPDLAAPWTRDKVRANDLDHAGWNAYELDSLEGPLQLWLVRRDVIIAAGCGLFLVGFVVAWTKRVGAWQIKCGTLAIAAAVAIMVPDWLAPLGSRLFLGLLGGWLVRWMTTVSRRQITPPSSSRHLTVPAGAAAVFIAAWVTGAYSARSAETSPPGSATSDRPIYDVLVPVDDHDRPTGDDVFVPQPFYDEIVARRAHHDGNANESLLTSAIYRGSLVEDAAGKAAVANDWTAHLELVTFAAGTNLQVPFGGDDVRLVPDGVRLDRHSSEFEWKNSGRSLAIVIPEAGRHELDLSFRPAPRTANSATTLDLAIPRAPNARLELDAPSDVSLDVPSAEGLVSRDKQGHLVAELGSADRLVIRAGQPAADELRPSLSTVDELLWLRVRPGSVILDTRFVVRVAQGSLRQVQLVADPRLRRLPLEGGTPIAQVQTQTAELNTISLILARAITDEVAIKLSFLVTETSGTGNLRIPRLDFVGARTVNRRLAVSIESPLAADDQSLTRLRAASVADFLAAWGPSDAKPRFAFELPDRADTWSLAVHAREPQLTASNFAVVSYGAERVSAAWMTDVNVEGGSVYQLPLSLPGDFTIDSVAVRESDEADRPLRWSRGASGDVTLFLPNAPTDHYQLLVRGSAPASVENSKRIPDLRIAGCTLMSQTTVILRQGKAMATVTDRGGLPILSGKEMQLALDRVAAAGLTDRAALSENDRLVAVLAGKPTAEAPLVRVVPNSPRIEGSQRTTVERNSGGWTATVDLDFTISGGVLDKLRFELPPQLKTIPDMTPAIPSKIVEIPGEANHWLVLRPAEPLVGTQHLQFRAPIAVAAGERFRVPDIRPLSLGSLRQIVLLPTISNDQHFFWETRGLKYEKLPTSFSSTSPHTEVQRTCEVVAERFEATLNSVEKSIRRPRVRLADVRLAMTDGANGFGVVSFDLDPAGSENCLLELPADEQLLHARVNDGSAVLTPIAPNQWSVAGAPARLPQRLEIIYAVDRSKSAANSGTELHAPTLVGFAVDQTLWSITSPGAVPVASVASESQAISPLDAALIRLEACSAMLESAGDQVSNETEDQAAKVYSAWARRLSIQRAAMDRERKHLGASASDAAVDAALRTVDGVQARLERSMGTKRNVSPTDQTEPASEPALIWTSVVNQDHRASVFLTAGPLTSLTIRSVPSSGDSLAIRMVLAIACAGLIVGAFWLARRREVQSAVARWPWAPAVLAGVAWWLWLSPSFVGLVIVVAAVAVDAYRVRRKRLLPQAVPARSSNPRSSIVTALTPTRHFPTQLD